VHRRESWTISICVVSISPPKNSKAQTLSGCDPRGVSLISAKLPGSNFSNAKLAGAQLDELIENA
jgi:uncharacterized protein YjbI with pentapeptide repeats